MDNIGSSEERLLELLRQCTVKLVVPNGHGTGFFIASDKILTCAHVVDAAQKTGKSVTANWNNHSYPVTIRHFLSEIAIGTIVRRG